MTQKTSDVVESVNSYWNSPECVEGYGPGHYKGLEKGQDEKIWTDLLLDAFGPGPAKALEIGSGTGYLSILLAKAGFDVVGVDQSVNMLEAARKNATLAEVDVEFRMGIASEFETGDNTFDCALARWVFWTLPNPVEVAKHVYSALKPGGKFFVFDGLWFKSFDDHNIDTDDERARRWDDSYTDDVRSSLPLMFDGGPEEVAVILEKAGFVDTESAWMTELSELYEKARPQQTPHRAYFASGVKPA